MESHQRKPGDNKYFLTCKKRQTIFDTGEAEKIVFMLCHCYCFVFFSGSALSDCCVICVCPYCALCQMKQHYDYYDGSDSEDEGDDADSNPTGGGIGGLNLTLSPFNIASNHPNKQSPR